jgi:hypothetical protein
MGFFSWKTQDTDETIWNKHSDQHTETVYMHDNKGNVWQEDNYEGYGEFGGKDYYDLLAEMNGLEGREAGIDLAYAQPSKPYYAPNLTSSREWKYTFHAPEEHAGQGYWPEDDD